MKPSVGRIVHVKSESEGEAKCFAADVAAVNKDGSVMLFVKDSQLRIASFIDNVTEGDGVGQWHVPERIE